MSLFVVEGRILFIFYMLHAFNFCFHGPLTYICNYFCFLLVNKHCVKIYGRMYHNILKLKEAQLVEMPEVPMSAGKQASQASSDF